MFRPHTPQRTQPQPGHRYDCAIVGAGLAGCELAWRLARAGNDVLLVSQALDHLGNLYQPDIANADFAPDSLFAHIAQQIAPQQDGWTFHRHLKAELEATAGLHLLQSTVTGLHPDLSLSTWEGPTLHAERIVLAVGAFLRARLHVGGTVEEAARLSEVAYDFLAEQLAQTLTLLPAQQTTPPHAEAPTYSVDFQTLAASELRGFQVPKLGQVYAVGRCTEGEHTYRSVLEDAARLAAEWERL